VLETFLLEHIPKRTGVTLVDFGGGTGRWLSKLDSYFTDSNFILVDLSESMLAEAKKKVSGGFFKNSIQLIHSDIAHISDIKSNTVDYIISTYNPLSFCPEPQQVICEAYRILKKGGVAQITIQGYYNALYSKVNNFLAPAEEIKAIFEEKKVQWTPEVPKLWQLSKDDVKKLFTKSGFKSITSRGIACVVQPQSEDFDPENKKVGSLSKQLANPDFFETLFEIEHQVGATDSAVDRAMNILTIGTK
jgi:ubiquinone/menaquinone biosynthesis C-methylase UbiE